MKLVESILTRNPCYTAGRKITVKGLMLHSVGCPQPKASAFISSWNSPSHGSSCVHGFIDGNDGTAYQTLPWNHRGWHCGSSSKGSGNNTHIGVEMCEPACIRYTAGSNFTCSNPAEARAVAKRTYEAAVELFAMLCRKYQRKRRPSGGYSPCTLRGVPCGRRRILRGKFPKTRLPVYACRHILENREYTGCLVNFKTTTNSTSAARLSTTARTNRQSLRTTMSR